MKSIEIPKIEDAIGKPGRILPKSLDGYSPIDGLIHCMSNMQVVSVLSIH